MHSRRENGNTESYLHKIYCGVEQLVARRAQVRKLY